MTKYSSNKDPRRGISWHPLLYAANCSVILISFCWLVINPTLGGTVAMVGTAFALLLLGILWQYGPVLPEAVIARTYLLGTLLGGPIWFGLSIVFQLLGNFLSQFIHLTN